MTTPSDGWMLAATCRALGPEAWDESTTAEQCATCRHCPVRLPCLTYALDTGAVDTVYGGQLFPHTPLRKDPAA